MGTNVNMKPIAHIMWDYAPQLCARLAPAQCDIFPQSKIFVLEQGKWESPEDTYSKNEAWISNLPQGAYSGRFKKSIVIRKCLFGRAITKRISWSLLPSLSVASISRLIVGPRNIMLHGLLLSLVDLLILRCFGKRIVYVHWGRPLSLSSHGKALDVLRYKLLSKVFVLMPPEARSFQSIMGDDNVATIVYPAKGKREYSQVSFINDKGAIDAHVILGNNCFCIDEYPLFLDKLQGGTNLKVVCMLNNGLERDEIKRAAFIAKYKKIFSDAFVPWVEVVPFDEYVKTQATCPFYCCPCAHQSGLGAISVSIRMGKGIFLRGDNYQHFKSMGCKIYNLDDFDSFTDDTWRQCILTKEEQLQNVKALEAYTAKYASYEYWRTSMEGALA